MPFNIIKQGFERLGWFAPNASQLPNISEEITQTLARLFGWHEEDKTFRAIAVDDEGKLRVTFEQVNVDASVNASVIVTNVSTEILPSNASRKSFSLVNVGNETVYLGFGQVAAIANGFPIYPAQIISGDEFFGTIYGIRTFANQEIRVLEF